MNGHEGLPREDPKNRLPEKERVKLPVSIWRTNEKKFEYGRFSQKVVQSVELDPDNVFADINRDNNKWSRPASVLP